MLETLFKGLFDSGTTAAIDVWQFLLCLGVALALGVVMAGSYCFRSRYT